MAGSWQITMTRPCRRITRHLSQIGLTLGLTFTFPILFFCYLYR
ncbi:putative membrane protein [Mycobacteroides abscessus subsp. bolletii 1513]|uniref:Putative membrane protein n=1 Tax=Mycobacteroides abscessus subsp. bolletii 1513 TaxID=1299321 RepID=X8DJ71_9MYCO|nr:putative membrane protein [Mycobacteroides abscessus subsp. bolletii 1513]